MKKLVGKISEYFSLDQQGQDILIEYVDDLIKSIQSCYDEVEFYLSAVKKRLLIYIKYAALEPNEHSNSFNHLTIILHELYKDAINGNYAPIRHVTYVKGVSHEILLRNVSFILSIISKQCEIDLGYATKVKSRLGPFYKPEKLDLDDLATIEKLTMEFFEHVIGVKNIAIKPSLHCMNNILIKWLPHLPATGPSDLTPAQAEQIQKKRLQVKIKRFINSMPRLTQAEVEGVKVKQFQDQQFQFQQFQNSLSSLPPTKATQLKNSLLVLADGFNVMDEGPSVNNIKEWEGHILFLKTESSLFTLANEVNEIVCECENILYKIKLLRLLHERKANVYETSFFITSLFQLAHKYIRDEPIESYYKIIIELKKKIIIPDDDDSWAIKSILYETLLFNLYVTNQKPSAAVGASTEAESVHVSGALKCFI